MKKLNFISPIGYTGYGITSLNILKELHNRCDISLFCMSDLNKLSLNFDEEKQLIRKGVLSSKKFSSSAPNLKIWHSNDLAMRPGKGRLFVFPFFELDTISEIDKHHINQCDLIFTASNWGKNILENNGINIPIVVAPLGVDSSIFNNQISRQDLSKNKYIFFHIGKWERRKSQDILLKCFEKAFCDTDNVELWLFPHNPFLSNEELNIWYSIVNSNNLKDKIKIFPRMPTQHDLNKMINLADCGVFVSRAEGWNNEILEAMAANKPIICTNYSAHTEYCDKNNAYLIDIQDTEPAFDNKWFHGEGNWAKLDNNCIDNIVDRMKYVYTYDIRTNTHGQDTARKYSWKNTANTIYNTIYANT